MVSSIFYLGSMLILFALFLELPKQNTPQNIAIWLPITYVCYECYACLLGGVFTIFNVPANINTIGCLNFFIALSILIFLKKNKKKQDYFWDKLDIICIAILLFIICITAIKHYGLDLDIRFETSDPGVHLKAAMDAMNNRSVLSPETNMYVGQFTNALWIELLFPIFRGTLVYKSFIIKNIINFFMAGWIFYAAIRFYISTRIGQISGLMFALIYIMGYPLNDFLFGFVYLGISITIITTLFFLTYVYMNEKYNNKIILFLMSLCCLGIAESYTLFAPPVFFALFVCILYKYLFKEGIKIKKFILCNLYVFLIPTVLCVWYSIIYPEISGLGWDNTSVIKSEGYIYRNLYADFLIFLPFSITMVFDNIKRKKWCLFTALFPIMIVYCICFFALMQAGRISTYYYYKLNFLLWLIIILMCFAFISDNMKKHKKLVIIYFMQWVIILGISITGIDYKFSEKNTLYNPFPNAHSTFEIYNFNKTIFKRKSEVNVGLVALCDYVESNFDEQNKIPFLGYWLDKYWYEALTNQRVPNNILIDDYLNGMFSSYIVVARKSEEYKSVKNSLRGLNIVFENDYGFVMTID